MVQPMAETVFTKIVAGQIPCHRLYEDEHVFAFLDIEPLSEGHALVIPKQPARTLDEVDDATAAALGVALVRVSRALKAVTGCNAYNILQNNESLAHQAVFHVHFHVIPKRDEDEGLGIEWPKSRLDHEAAAKLAERIREEIAT
jgi:histidine triad (HIT) family protein